MTVSSESTDEPSTDAQHGQGDGHEEIVPATGILVWLTTVDHKKIGLMYIVSALMFFCIGGIEAGLMRLQLAVPDNDIISPEFFNQLFTMHGTTMVFLVGMPFFFGFANYFAPLMIGARDMAFPRLNAFSFWLYLFGGGLLYFSYVGSFGLYGTAEAPDVGWFAYAPLTEPTYSPGHSTDYWLLGIMMGGFASLATAGNLVATILTMRCPGMTLKKMPIFVWMMLIDSSLVLVALPPLSGGQIMTLLDRHFGAHFFNSQAGGDPMLWQHLFWFFGHPEVYILIIPGFAFASEIIPVFSRKVLFGFPAMVGATAMIAILGLVVWAHHMFTIGLGAELNTFFAASTMLISVPTGIKIFNWLATMYGGKMRMELPMMCCLAFIGQFLVAGLTGVMLAVVPFDWQLHDTYFVVAHFHFILIGGLVFCIFGAIYYWYPKVIGRMLDDNLGRWHFWLFLAGFNLTFIPMHLTGIVGMARHLYTYREEDGWGFLNMLSSLGFVVQAVAMLIFIYNLVRSAKKGRVAGNDPWDAWTLEWATTSPPPDYNFNPVPEIKSRRPLWDLKHPSDPDWKHE
jgi:cytochrome c oxidase subunit I